MDVGAVYRVPSPASREPILPPTPILSCGRPVTVLLGLPQLSLPEIDGLTAEACMGPEQSSNQESEAPDALAQPASLSICVDLGKLWFPPPWRGDIRPCPSICPGGGQQGSASQVGPETTLTAFFP